VPDAPTDAPALSVELERLALRALATAYDDLNHALFRGHLRPPAIEFSDATSRLGAWRGDRRVLEISRPLLVRHGWGVVVEVLKHEMAHQFVEEIEGVRDEGPHGAAFRRVCDERGIDLRATGVPDAAGASGARDEAVLDRIAKLLALATSANEHEAHAAMRAAQRLMLRHNLDTTGAAEARGFGFRHLGEPTGRVGEAERILASILQDHFFVQVIRVPVWRAREGKRGSVLEVCGTPTNLDLAAYVHGFLVDTSARLWAEHARRTRARRRDRRAYLAGVMQGFRDQLDRQAEADRGEGLVWVGDPALERYLRKRHPHVRWSRARSSAGTAAHAHGRAAGRDIVLHRGITRGASHARRLLPARSHG
jgi:hypothetical protein